MKGAAEAGDSSYFMTSGVSVLTYTKRGSRDGSENLVSEEKKDARGMEVMETQLYGRNRTQKENRNLFDLSSFFLRSVWYILPVFL